ncbi:hypothetical protein CQW23_17445 [Capsicum baccatum]|uniref:Uncharacterized protein n=1 Tax=Capsicum baccatum TaxID=33114 RepID=A0A2G2WE81_CAPBA|nr:hypothetical protein CQW23_17445 [Capsicum baccatum]
MVLRDEESLHSLPEVGKDLYSLRVIEQPLEYLMDMLFPCKIISKPSGILSFGPNGLPRFRRAWDSEAMTLEDGSFGTSIRTGTFAAGICDLIWTWERVLSFQLRPVGDIDKDEPLIPFGRKWTRGKRLKRDTEVHHALVPMRDQLDYLTSEQFMWIPYRDILHTLPPCCTSSQEIWRMRVPMCNAPENEHNQAVNMWIHWQPSVLEAHHDADLDAYMGWYLRHSQLLLGNPTVGGSRYIPIVPSHEVMCRGLKKLYDKVLAWTLSPNLLTREHRAEIANVIRRTFDQNASHGPMDVTEETQVLGRMKNHKSKHCADPVAAIKRRDNKYGDDDVHEGLRPRHSIRFRSCVYPFFEELRLKRMDVSDESLEFLAKSFHGFKVGEDEFGYMVADILKESNINSDGMHFDPGARTTLAFVRVDGADNEAEAAKIDRFVASSSLVKAAVYGRDPNWG